MSKQRRTRRSTGTVSQVSKRNVKRDSEEFDTEKEETPKRPRLDEEANLNDHEDMLQGEVKEKRVIEENRRPMSFHEVLATQDRRNAPFTPSIDDSSDIDRDRESSSDPGFSEINELIGTLHPSQSQGSKPMSRAHAENKKQRSSVGTSSKSNVTPNAKPISKPEEKTSVISQKKTSTSNAEINEGVAPERPQSTKSSLAKATRHEVHWYLDGSIIVHMQDTLFRLHRSALVRKSIYFARLFKDRLLNDLGDGSRVENMNGCPVVHVTGNPKDFAILLDALDVGICFVSKAPPFSTLAAILRASTRFEFTLLREWAVYSLEQMWPNDLNSVTPVVREHAMESLQLARECGVKNVLKRVLYEIVRTGGFGLHTLENKDKVVNPRGVDDSEDEDEDNPDEEDGGDQTMAEAEPGDFEEDHDLAPDEDTELAENETRVKGLGRLSGDDIRILIIARERLADEWRTRAVHAPDPMCENFAMHRRDDALWTTLVHRTGVYEARMYDPLVGLSVLANLGFSDEPYHEKEYHGELRVPWRKRKWCSECAPRMENVFKNARSKIWENLDIWFDLM